MEEWDRSMLAVSGAEYEIQETLQSMKRLLGADSVRSTTRVVLEGAALVLQNELELQPEGVNR
jgi:hypothetical protein